MGSTDLVLVCADCASSIPEDDAEDAGWRFYSDGFELLPFCPTCSAREFAADAGASDDA